MPDSFWLFPGDCGGQGRGGSRPERKCRPSAHTESGRCSKYTTIALAHLCAESIENRDNKLPSNYVIMTVWMVCLSKTIHNVTHAWRLLRDGMLGTHRQAGFNVSKVTVSYTSKFMSQ